MKVLETYKELIPIKFSYLSGDKTKSCQTVELTSEQHQV